MVVVVVDGRGVCSWFFDCEVYYFYCSIYITLLY